MDHEEEEEAMDIVEEVNFEGDVEEEPVIEETEIDPDDEDENEASQSTLEDQFLQHYERELPEGIQLELKSGVNPYKNVIQYNWPYLGTFQYFGLKAELASCSGVQEKEASSTFLSTLSSTRKVFQFPPAPEKESTSTKSFEELSIKKQLYQTIPVVNKGCVEKEKTVQNTPITPLQSELLSLMVNYHDLYFTERNLENGEAIRNAYCIHAVNHILKTRTRILHHNAKLVTKIEVPDEFRDQGFVRPKVLILTPFKETALRIMNNLISLILPESKGNVMNKKRFVDEYSGETLFMPKTNPKPEDYMAIFSGNIDDNFKIGLSVTKKAIKLYTGFYSSDIIIASPLGLRLIIGADKEKGRDFDFLSSIELLIMDQADLYLMQNWEHVLHLIRHLHLQPTTTHGTDFSRIRPWAIDGFAKYYCQTLLFSSNWCPEHNSLFSKYCKNFAGLIKVTNPVLKGSICKVTVQLPQMFQQFECNSLKEMSDQRFEFFTKNVLPNFKDRLMSNTLIFISSYFDFVRLRNYFKKEEMSFIQICEYTKDNKLSRARDYFYHNKKHFMLYTERAHFFRRFRLKGVGHILFYDIPQNPHFYYELCNFMQSDWQNRRVKQRKNSSVNVIYCKYDAPRLARIVSSERASYMISSEKKVHAFVTEDI